MCEYIVGGWRDRGLGLTRRAQLMRSSSLATTYSPRLLGSMLDLGTTAPGLDTAGWILGMGQSTGRCRQGRTPGVGHWFPPQPPTLGHSLEQSHGHSLSQGQCLEELWGQAWVRTQLLNMGMKDGMDMPQLAPRPIYFFGLSFPI